MTDTKRGHHAADETEGEQEVQPLEAEAVREAVEALKGWQENAIVIAIANGIRGKYLDLMLGMKKGNPKAGPYTFGYLDAYKDIHASLQLIIKNEEIPDVATDTADSEQPADADEGTAGERGGVRGETGEPVD